MIAATPERVPILSAHCRLYFDGQHNRWVFKAPQQIMFPDQFTLTVLQACDGRCSEQQIAHSLVACSTRDNVTIDDVLDLLDEFERRGYLSVMSAAG